MDTKPSWCPKLNLAFRHERARVNIQQDFQEENIDIINNESATSIQRNELLNQPKQHHQISREIAHESPLHFLKSILPDTPHNIYIVHAIRQYNNEMSRRLNTEDSYYKTTESYRNNKISLRFLLNKLVSIEDCLLKQERNLHSRRHTRADSRQWQQQCHQQLDCFRDSRP